MAARQTASYEGLMMGFLVFCTGCGTVSISGNQNLPDGTMAESDSRNWDTPEEATSNAIPELSSMPDGEAASGSADTEREWIASAERITLTNEHNQWQGSIDASEEVDLYDLGSMFAGEWITVEVNALSGDLNPVAALFDSDMNLLYANDDRAYYSGLKDSRITMPIPADLETCYLGVASSYQSGTTGEYEIVIQLEERESSRSSAEQLVYLDFEGTDDLWIGTYGPILIRHFDDTLPGMAYPDDTEALMNMITMLIQEKYRDMPITILSSLESGTPGGEHTTIYFGGYDANALGRAENVDELNMRASQKAVIYTESFEIFEDYEPTYEEMAHALANVAAHEIGHLFGLQHTQGANGLMSIDRTKAQFLKPCEFKRARLASEVFPIGYQDALLSLDLALNPYHPDLED